jgi:hypothetical protein
VRLGLQFTDYPHLYGGTNNFDGLNLGLTHNAAGNNSVFAYAWFAFSGLARQSLLSHSFLKTAPP